MIVLVLIFFAISFLWSEDSSKNQEATESSSIGAVGSIKSLPKTADEVRSFICERVEKPGEFKDFNHLYQALSLYVPPNKWEGIVDQFSEVVHCQPFEQYPDFLLVMLCARSNVLDRARLVGAFLGKESPSERRVTLYKIPFASWGCIRRLSCSPLSLDADTLDSRVDESMRGAPFERVFGRHMHKQWSPLASSNKVGS